MMVFKVCLDELTKGERTGRGNKDTREPWTFLPSIPSRTQESSHETKRSAHEVGESQGKNHQSRAQDSGPQEEGVR